MMNTCLTDVQQVFAKEANMRTNIKRTYERTNELTCESHLVGGRACGRATDGGWS